MKTIYDFNGGAVEPDFCEECGRPLKVISEAAGDSRLEYLILVCDGGNPLRKVLNFLTGGLFYHYEVFLDSVPKKGKFDPMTGERLR